MDTKILIFLFVCIIECFAKLPKLHFPWKHPGVQPFIVNGTEVATGSHKYMVALVLGDGENRQYVCGGSLISKRTVLTAAHCIQFVYQNGALAENLGIVVGTNRWKTSGTFYPINRNTTHQEFDPLTFENDIGLLFTKDDVALTDDVEPINLTFDDIKEDVEAKVTGWGSSGVNQGPSEILQEVQLKTISGEKCVEEVVKAAAEYDFPNSTVKPRVEICTYVARGVGICSGDSGSPLIRVSDGLQIGIVSWGFPCALGVPDIFTRISAFDEWIRKNKV